MADAAHTPGPWAPQRSLGLHDGAYDFAINSNGVRVIAEAFGRSADGDYLNAEANARLIAAAPALLSLLTEIVDEFGCSIQQYHKNGPDFTHKDGTEVFHVSVLLDREGLIERARAAVATLAASEGR